MSDWFSPSLLLPPMARVELASWTDSIDWPEGTKLKDSERYHITLAYCAKGRKHPRHEAFLTAIQPPASFKVWTARVEQLSPGNALHARPIGVVLSNPLFVQWVERYVIELAQALGLEPSMFGSYLPHVTVAEIPPTSDYDVRNIPPPDVTWMTPMEAVDLHAYYDELKGT